ncbi:hypothetical protein [Mesorhizobium sp. P5_C1]
MNTARDQLATAYKTMKKADISAHALDLADELEGLAEMITGQNVMLTSLAELIGALKTNIRAIDTLAREGKKRAAREALAALAAIPDIAPVPVAVFSPEWSTAMFSPAEARH